MVTSGAPDDAQGLPVLTGHRTRLRAWTPDDAAAIHAACQDPAIQRWTRVPSPYRASDARDFLDHRVPEARARGGAAFCVEPRDAGHLAGSMALLHLGDGVGEIGYWTAPWARGRGLARDALEVLCRWCFDHLAAARLELLVEPDNHPSRALAVGAGFAVEGTLRRRLLLDGHRRDVVRYARAARISTSGPSGSI